MFKRYMIGLVAASLVIAWLVPEAGALFWRGRTSVFSIHTCLEFLPDEVTIDPCFGAEEVMDRVFGAEEVTTTTTKDGCLTLGYFWSEAQSKCYKPTCEIKGTLVCENTDKCGIVDETTVGLSQSSFEAQGFFNDEDFTAKTYSDLDQTDGQFVCEEKGLGAFLDYLPDAIVTLTTYIGTFTNISGATIYERIDVCPTYGLTGEDNEYDCEFWWDSTLVDNAENPLPRPNLPCCSEQFQLTVNIEPDQSGSVSYNNPSESSCSEDCTVTYGTGAPGDDPCAGSLDVELTATANSGYEFIGWDGGDCSGTGTCIVSAKDNPTVTANFAIANYTLTLTKLDPDHPDLYNGDIISDPNILTCRKNCQSVTAENVEGGTVVTLSASKTSDMTGWLGLPEGTEYSDYGASSIHPEAPYTVTFTVNDDLNITALFEYVDQPR